MFPGWGERGRKDAYETEVRAERISGPMGDAPLARSPADSPHCLLSRLFTDFETSAWSVFV